MRRRVLALATAMAIVTGMALPLAASAGSRPTASMSKPGGCETIHYDWSRFRKAHTATILLYHDGIYEAERSTGPVGPSGTYPMPTDLVALVVPGEHYTVFGKLEDSAGRTIVSSGAAWWGVC